MNFLRIDNPNDRENEPEVLNLDHVSEARWEQYQRDGEDHFHRKLVIVTDCGRLTLKDGHQAHEVWSHLQRIAVNPTTGRPTFDPEGATRHAQAVELEQLRREVDDLKTVLAVLLTHVGQAVDWDRLKDPRD